MTDNPKDLNSLIQAAFEAGVAHGAGYEDKKAIPPGETGIQFRAWWDWWHGDAWDPQRWHDARVRAGLITVDGKCVSAGQFYQDLPLDEHIRNGV